ncbi:MAG: PRC-barrel domain containing protein [Coriobacteriia bacterium]|nr:PRC-barrel domain containing protein [Coriobacteriia bacterium]
MLTTKEIQGITVFKSDARKGKIGKISSTVFSPEGNKVVGFIIKRPDLAMMIKRSDVFLALDAFDEKDGFIFPTKGAESFDEKAIKRLKLDWDSCIIWENMDVKSESGQEIGRVGSMTFNTQTGELSSITINDGISSQALIGLIEIPAQHLMGYKDGFLILDDEALEIQASGGAAAKAGEAFAKATKNITITQEKGKQAARAVDKAAQKGGYALGKQLKESKGMFSNFKKEFDKARKGE